MGRVKTFRRHSDENRIPVGGDNSDRRGTFLKFGARVLEIIQCTRENYWQ